MFSQQDDTENRGGSLFSRIISIILLIGSIVLTVLAMFWKPTFPASREDVSLFRLGCVLLCTFALVIPSVIILLMTFRDRIHFLEKIRIGQAVFACLIAILIGLGSPLYIGKGYSDHYKEKREQYGEYFRKPIAAPSSLADDKVFAFEDLPEELATNIALACDEIGIDSSKIDYIDAIQQTSNGLLYRFFYEDTPVAVEFDCRFKVQEIYWDDYTYRPGYVPVKFTDVFISDEEFELLEEKSRQLIEDNATDVSYEDISDTWETHRNKDVYSIKGLVEIREESEPYESVEFQADYRKTGDVFQLEYFILGDRQICGTESIFVIPQLVRVPMESYTPDPNAGPEIVLSNDEPGLYGKLVQIEGEERVLFYLPEGHYSVMCYGESSQINIYQSSGRFETDLAFDESNYGHTEEIYIPAGGYIIMSNWSTIEMLPLDS